jgi:hypothetical protein
MMSNTMPTLEAFREGRSNKETYTVFCDLFLAEVVGRNNWNRKIMTEKLTTVATKSDEAFALLVLANNWDRAQYWSEQRKAGVDDKVIKAAHPATLYTMEGGSAQTDKGWIDAGLEAMRSFYQDVHDDRSLFGKEFNKHFLSTQQKDGHKKRNANKTGPQESSAQKKKRMVPHDFENDDDNLSDDDNSTK